MLKRFWNSNVELIHHNYNDEPTIQNLLPYYEENPCLYFFSSELYLKNDNRIDYNKRKMFEFPKKNFGT